MRRLLYLLREAVANVLTNRTTTLVAVATTAFTFACVGVFLLLYVNLKTMATSLEQDIQVMVYLQDDVTEQARNDIEQQLKADRAIGSLTFVSKERALADFQAQFPPSLGCCRTRAKPAPGLIRRDVDRGVSLLRRHAALGQSHTTDSRRRSGSV